MDHIEDWPDHTREFGDTDRTIRLIFTPCLHAPRNRMLVLGLELVGSVYENIQKNAKIDLPPPSSSSRRLIDAVSRGGHSSSTSHPTSSTLALASSFSYQSMPIPTMRSTVSSKTDHRVQIAHRSSETSLAMSFVSSLPENVWWWVGK